MHFRNRLLQLLICSYPMLQHVIQTELSSTSQYLSTNLMIPPNQSLDVHKYFAFDFLFIIITIAELHLLPYFCSSRSRFSDINQHRSTFNKISVDNSDFRFYISIFLFPKYFSKDIPCTFSHCQCSSTSTLTTAVFTIFAVQINRFDNREINNLASVYLVKRADIAPDGAYLSHENRVSNPLPAFYNAFFKASIKSASDYC